MYARIRKTGGGFFEGGEGVGVSATNVSRPTPTPRFTNGFVPALPEGDSPHHHRDLMEAFGGSILLGDRWHSTAASPCCSSCGSGCGGRRLSSRSCGGRCRSSGGRARDETAPCGALTDVVAVVRELALLL